VVLVGATVIEGYRACLDSLAPEIRAIPKVCIQDIFPSMKGCGIPNAVGIYFQAPISTSIMQYEKVTGKSYNRIGVLYRENMTPFIEKNVEPCWKSGMTLSAKRMKNKDPELANTVGKALEELNKTDRVQVIWLPDDDDLLRSDIISEVILPFKQIHDIVFLVSSQKYMTAPWNLGTYCIMPDIPAIGSQVVSIMNTIELNGWVLNEVGISPLNKYSGILPSAYTRATPPESSKPVAEAPKEPPREPPPAVVETVEVRPLVETAVPADEPESKPEPRPVAPPPKVAANNLPQKTSEPVAVKKAPGKIAPAPQLHPGNDTRAREAEIEQAVNAEKARIIDSLAVLNQFNTKYALITASSALVLSSQASDATILGYARQGDLFPLINEDSVHFAIDFFKSKGYISKKYAQVWAGNPSLRKNSPVSIIIAVIIIVLAAAALMFLIIYRSREARATILQPPRSRCAVLVAREKAVAQEDQIGHDIAMHLHRIGFEIRYAKSSRVLRMVLNSYAPDIIGVDSLLEKEMEVKIRLIIEQRSTLAQLCFIFFNTRGVKGVTRNSYYQNMYNVGLSISANEFYQIISPLINLSHQPGTTRVIPRSDLEGTVLDGNLPEIFQFIELGRKTGCLLIEDEKPYGMVLSFPRPPQGIAALRRYLKFSIRPMVHSASSPINCPRPARYR
jgi:hypothetical protein